MKPLIGAVFASIFLLGTNVYADFSDDMETSAKVGIQFQDYSIHPQNKHGSNLTAYQELELKYYHDNFKAYSKIYAQEDAADAQEASEHNGRTFLRLDELYGQYDFDNSNIKLGKSIEFWGALEVRNITDGFNPIDLRNDPSEKTNKLGVWNGAYTYYTDTGELSLIVKFYEQDQHLAQLPYVYYFLPSFIHYNSKLSSEKGRSYPSTYLKYSASTEWEMPLDYAVILEHGYDSQRYFNIDGPLNGSPVNAQNRAYLVNKVSTYNTLVVGSALVKLEALYTDVIDNKDISDYYHVGAGIEYTIANFLENNGDLGLISEYYYYRTLEGDKYDDLGLFETMQNDLFLGLRYSFNDDSDSSFLGGVILDTQYIEQSYSMKYETRVNDVVNVKVDWQYIEPSVRALTAYRLIGRHQRIGIDLSYSF
jgi:hypothetical protein